MTVLGVDLEQALRMGTTIPMAALGRRDDLRSMLDQAHQQDLILLDEDLKPRPFEVLSEALRV